MEILDPMVISYQKKKKKIQLFVQVRKNNLKKSIL